MLLNLSNEVREKKLLKNNNFFIIPAFLNENPLFLPFLKVICQKMKGKKVLSLCGKLLVTALLICGFKTSTYAQATYNIGVIGGGQYVNMSWDGPKTVKMYDTTKNGATYK